MVKYKLKKTALKDGNENSNYKIGSYLSKAVSKLASEYLNFNAIDLFGYSCPVDVRYIDDNGNRLKYVDENTFGLRISINLNDMHKILIKSILNFGLNNFMQSESIKLIKNQYKSKFNEFKSNSYNNGGIYVSKIIRFIANNNINLNQSDFVGLSTADLLCKYNIDNINDSVLAKLNQFTKQCGIEPILDNKINDDNIYNIEYSFYLKESEIAINLKYDKDKDNGNEDNGNIKTNLDTGMDSDPDDNENGGDGFNIKEIPTGPLASKLNKDIEFDEDDDDDDDDDELKSDLDKYGVKLESPRYALTRINDDYSDYYDKTDVNYLLRDSENKIITNEPKENRYTFVNRMRNEGYLIIDSKDLKSINKKLIDLNLDGFKNILDELYKGYIADKRWNPNDKNTSDSILTNLIESEKNKILNEFGISKIRNSNEKFKQYVDRCNDTDDLYKLIYEYFIITKKYDDKYKPIWYKVVEITQKDIIPFNELATIKNPSIRAKAIYKYRKYGNKYDAAALKRRKELSDSIYLHDALPALYNFNGYSKENLNTLAHHYNNAANIFIRNFNDEFFDTPLNSYISELNDYLRDKKTNKQPARSFLARLDDPDLDSSLLSKSLYKNGNDLAFTYKLIIYQTWSSNKSHYIRIDNLNDALSDDNGTTINEFLTRILKFINSYKIVDDADDETILTADDMPNSIDPKLLTQVGQVGKLENMGSYMLIHGHQSNPGDNNYDSDRIKNMRSKAYSLGSDVEKDYVENFKTAIRSCLNAMLTSINSSKILASIDFAPLFDSESFIISLSQDSFWNANSLTVHLIKRYITQNGKMPNKIALNFVINFFIDQILNKFKDRIANTQVASRIETDKKFNFEKSTLEKNDKMLSSLNSSDLSENITVDTVMPCYLRFDDGLLAKIQNTWYKALDHINNEELTSEQRDYMREQSSIFGSNNNDSEYKNPKSAQELINTYDTMIGMTKDIVSKTCDKLLGRQLLKSYLPVNTKNNTKLFYISTEIKDIVDKIVPDTSKSTKAYSNMVYDKLKAVLKSKLSESFAKSAETYGFDLTSILKNKCYGSDMIHIIKETCNQFRSNNSDDSILNELSEALGFNLNFLKKNKENFNNKLNEFRKKYPDSLKENYDTDFGISSYATSKPASQDEINVYKSSHYLPGIIETRKVKMHKKDRDGNELDEIVEKNQPILRLLERTQSHNISIIPFLFDYGGVENSSIDETASAFQFDSTKSIYSLAKWMSKYGVSLSVPNDDPNKDDIVETYDSPYKCAVALINGCKKIIMNQNRKYLGAKIPHINIRINDIIMTPSDPNRITSVDQVKFKLVGKAEFSNEADSLNHQEASKTDYMRRKLDIENKI